MSMIFTEVTDKLIRVTNYPKQATVQDFKDFFTKVSNVAGVFMFEEVTFIVFDSTITQDQVAILDGVYFMDGSISITHARDFTEHQKEEFKKLVTEGSISHSETGGFEVINKEQIDGDRKEDLQREREGSSELEKSTRDRKRRDQRNEEDITREGREEEELHFKPYSKRDEAEKKRSDEQLRSSTRTAPEKETKEIRKDSSGYILMKPEFWGIVASIYIICQTTQVLFGY